VLLDLNLGSESGFDLLGELMRQEAPPQIAEKIQTAAGILAPDS